MSEPKVLFLEDLPPEQRPKTRNRNWRKVADALQKRPHKLALIGEVSRSTITHLRDGRYKDFRPTSDWEWTMRNKEDDPHGGRVILLGKYVGVPPPPLEED